MIDILQKLQISRISKEKMKIRASAWDGVVGFAGVDRSEPVRPEQQEGDAGFARNDRFHHITRKGIPNFLRRSANAFRIEF